MRDRGHAPRPDAAAHDDGRIPGELERMGAYMVAHEVRYAPFLVGRLTVYNLAGQRLWSVDEVAPLHALDSGYTTCGFTPSAWAER